MRVMGGDLATWRRLRRLTAAQVADRAGVSRKTVENVERGRGSTLESLLRVARALGVLDQVTGAFDPYATDVGRVGIERSGDLVQHAESPGDPQQALQRRATPAFHVLHGLARHSRSVSDLRGRQAPQPAPGGEVPTHDAHRALHRRRRESSVSGHDRVRPPKE